MIGIIVAMTCEKDAITPLVENAEVINYKHREFIKGTISNKEVVIMQGGVGKVSAGISTTQMLEQFDIDALINIGCAGGIKEEEEILDVVISNRLTYHDWDTESIDGVGRSFDCNQYAFTSDPKLIEIAKKAMKSTSNCNVFIGDIVSGDTFVSDEKTVKFIQDNFPTAIACEMEATSVAHAASEYDVPFVCLRSLSDIVIRENNGNDFMENAMKAASRSAEFTKKFLELL